MANYIRSKFGVQQINTVLIAINPSQAGFYDRHILNIYQVVKSIWRENRALTGTIRKIDMQ